MSLHQCYFSFSLSRQGKQTWVVTTKLAERFFSLVDFSVFPIFFKREILWQQFFNSVISAKRCLRRRQMHRASLLRIKTVPFYPILKYNFWRFQKLFWFYTDAPENEIYPSCKSFCFISSFVKKRKEKNPFQPSFFFSCFLRALIGGFPNMQKKKKRKRKRGGPNHHAMNPKNIIYEASLSHAYLRIFFNIIIIIYLCVIPMWGVKSALFLLVEALLQRKGERGRGLFACQSKQKRRRRRKRKKTAAGEKWEKETHLHFPERKLNFRKK